MSSRFAIADFRLSIVGWVAGAAFGQNADITGDGCVDLQDVAVMQREMTGPQCTSGDEFMEMVLVPGGGAGPAYDFLIGKYEVTNEQFVAFLNDAEADAGATARGAFMLFQEYDWVVLPSGEPFVGPGGWIMHNSDAVLGQRYRTQRGYERYPVIEVSWLGAVKFCNWLTLHAGMMEEDRCYTEGQVPLMWHPVTVPWRDWRSRDINDTERQGLVASCRGFRLPMDNSYGASSWNTPSAVESAYTEWYKAAAYDPGAPDVARIDPLGESVSAHHWAFGFGRDEITFRDANYWTPGYFPAVPFYGPGSVGYFNGFDWLWYDLGTTNNTGNRLGLHDMSGNVAEWTQDGRRSDIDGEPSFVVRGGSWRTDSPEVAASSRKLYPVDYFQNGIGFRVVRVP